MNKFDKANKMLEDGLVKLDSESDNMYWFSVRDIYWTKYHKHVDEWSCTCMSYVYAPQLACSHVISCKILLNNIKKVKA